MAPSRRKRNSSGNDGPSSFVKRRAMGEGVESSPPSFVVNTRKSSRLASMTDKPAAVNVNPDQLPVASYKEDHKKVPLHVKELYGQIGFVKWTNTYCPILIINPCQAVQQDNLPVGIYHAWMTALENALTFQAENNGGREDSGVSFPLLIYWYGTYYEYSVVSPRHIIRYDDAVREGYDVIPDFVKHRRENQLLLPYAYELNFLALPMVSADLDKLPRDRRVVLPAISSNTTETTTSRQQRRKNKLSAELETVSSSVVLNEWHTLALTEKEGNSRFSPEIANKKRFEINRKKVLRCISPLVTETFGKIGFSSDAKQTTSANRKRSRKQTGGMVSKVLHPVLILSPFRCPPGPIRSEWFDRYHKWVTASPSSKESIPCLVYWYGAYTCGQSSARPFSFVQLSRILSYEDGVENGHDKLSAEVLSRYHENDSKKGKKGGIGRASMLQDWFVCGHWEFQHALALSPSNRWGGMQDFEEDYSDDFVFYRECVGEAEASTSNEESCDEESHANDEAALSNRVEEDSIAEGSCGKVAAKIEGVRDHHDSLRNDVEEKSEIITDDRAPATVHKGDDSRDDTEDDSDSDSAVTVVVLDDSASCASSDSSILTPLPGEKGYCDAGIAMPRQELMVPPFRAAGTDASSPARNSEESEKRHDADSIRCGPLSGESRNEQEKSTGKEVETIDADENAAFSTSELRGNSSRNFMGCTHVAWTKENADRPPSYALDASGIECKTNQIHSQEKFACVLGLNPKVMNYGSLPDSQQSKPWNVSIAILPSATTSESSKPDTISNASKDYDSFHSSMLKTDPDISSVLASSSDHQPSSGHEDC